MNSNIDLYTDTILFSYSISNALNDGFALHCHTNYEIFYFIDGDISYLVEGKRYTPTPHSILLLPPKSFHGVKIESNKDYKRYALHFNANIVSLENRELLLSTFNTNKETSNIYYENVNSFNLQNFFEILLECREMSSDLKEIFIRIRIEALLSQILFMSRSINVSSSKDHISRPVDNIIAYLNEHLIEDITLDELSNKFYISKHHLNKVFRKATGTTIYNYILYKKVNLAQQLIAQGQSASLASINAGFHDYSSFFRAYKRIYCTSPSNKNSGKMLL
jgi:AraC-type DNA-binding domain-containing proteins